MCLVPAVVCVGLHSGFACLPCVTGIDFIAVSPCTYCTVQDSENRVELYCWWVSLGVVSDTGSVKFKSSSRSQPVLFQSFISFYTSSYLCS